MQKTKRCPDMWPLILNKELKLSLPDTKPIFLPSCFSSWGHVPKKGCSNDGGRGVGMPPSPGDKT